MTKQAWWVIDPLFGDGGKGALVDFLTARLPSSLNVRYTGGSQSARTVQVGIKKHTFHQLSAGTLAGAQTVLGPQVRVDPVTLYNEVTQVEHLGYANLWEKLWVDENCLIISPYHVAESQRLILEHRRGSTGMGVGVAWRHALEHPQEAIFAKDLKKPDYLYRRLQLQQNRFKQAAIDKHAPTLRTTAEIFMHTGSRIQLIHNWNSLRDEHEVIVAEGAHGFYLDRQFGFKPFVTSSKTDFSGAEELFFGDQRPVTRIGAVGIYTARHGVGPHPTECAELAHLVDNNQTASEGQGLPRNGWLNCNLLWRSASFQKLDCLCINRTDLWGELTSWKLALRGLSPSGELVYWETDNLSEFLQKIEDQIQIPILVIGAGSQRPEYRWR